MTAPQFSGRVAISQTGASLGDGLIFVAPNGQDRSTAIFDNQANLIYYRSQADRLFDFKRQPNGLLTYFDAGTNSFKVLDNTYTVVDTWTVGNGLVADLHEFLLLPNGHALFMIYDLQPVDLSSLGGRPDAAVIDLVLQELDQDKNVVFEWNSRDHMSFTETFEPLDTAVVDYVHGNAIEVDADGNLLISSRHLSEITKIDRSTGAIIWRLGGKNNQFTFVGDPTLPSVGGFSYQHDIRRLPNGTLRSLTTATSSTLPTCVLHEALSMLLTKSPRRRRWCMNFAPYLTLFHSLWVQCSVLPTVIPLSVGAAAPRRRLLQRPVPPLRSSRPTDKWR